MHRFNIRHYHFIGKVDLIEVSDNLLCYLFWNVIIDWCVRLDGAILVVRDLVQGRNIHAGDRPCRLVQEVPTGVSALALHTDIEAHDRWKHILALSYIEQIKEIGDRLGVIGAGTAADDNRCILRAVLGAERNFCKVEHIEHVGVAHLVLKRKSNEVEVSQRIAAFQGGERQIVYLHLLLHIDPRVVYAFAPDVLVLVE